MDRYSEEFIEIKRKNWKKSFTRKIKNSKDSNEAICQIISEYLYYSKKSKELKKRVKKIVISMEHQMKNIPFTRNDLNKKNLDKIKNSLTKLKHELKG